MLFAILSCAHYLFNAVFFLHQYLFCFSQYCFTQSLSILDPENSGNAEKAVRATLSKPFRPGQFFADMATAGVQFGISREEVVKKIVSAAEQHFAGIFSFLLI